MTEEVRVYYPREEAIQKAAEQNFLRDVRVGVETESSKKKVFPLYLEEATFLIDTTGENYIPAEPDVDLICLQVG